MAYKKGNRHLTDHQFSKGTTIDGSRIDDAISDIIEEHNDIKQGDMEAQWLPETISVSWQPSKSLVRFMANQVGPPANSINGTSRYGVTQTDAKQYDWFPFMVAQNAPSEVFPSDEQPKSTVGFTNRFRSKGYYVGPTDISDETFSRNSNNPNTMNTAQDSNDNSSTFPSTDSGGSPFLSPSIAGSGQDATHKLYFTLDIPIYFDNPVIITNVSVFGGQEHPLGAYNSYLDPAAAGLEQFQIGTDGYKIPVFQAISNATPGYDAYQPNNNSATAFETNLESVTAPLPAELLPATTGTELPGELYTWTQQNLGDATVQLSIDNLNLPENRSLNSVIFSKTDLGDSACTFNRQRTTGNRGTALGAVTLASNNGAIFEDMEPRYSGGSTWGVWIKEDNLNIPIPAKTRMHYTVTVKGFRPQQLFDWHIALTFLERLEK